MSATNFPSVTIETLVQVPRDKAWDLWNGPEHITKWASASDDWHTPRAENDLRTGGSFSSRMEAKDGSMGFDFGGVYDEVRPKDRIAYTMGDGRTVDIRFAEEDGATRITQTFDAETSNPVDMQRDGWQAILNNFKKYAEAR
jgi:uncharacterized protein YndB with AHSA1/START domain